MTGVLARVAPRTDPRRLLLPVLAVAVPVAWLMLPNLGFVPIFDGGVYAECAQRVVASGDLNQLSCVDHPSLAVIGPEALVFALTGGSSVALLTIAALAFLASLGAMAAVVELLFPDASALERALTVLAIGLWPPMAANMLNPSPDTGILVALPFALLGILARRRLLAVAGGIGLTFSKETGIAIFFVLAASHVIAFGWIPAGGWKRRWAEVRFHLVLLVVPAVFAAYLLNRVRQGLAPIWTAAFFPGGPQGLAAALPLQFGDSVFRNYMGLIFMVNFAWVLTGAVAVLTVLRGALWVAGIVTGRRPGPRPRRPAVSSRGAFLWIATVALLYLLTRLRTFGNERYFVSLIPLFVMNLLHQVRGTVAQLARLWPRRQHDPRPAAGAAVLAAVVLVFGISEHRTVDPVSSAYYHTFSAGDRQLLDLTSITGECCGHGRDQLIYNQQFTNFSYLVSDFASDRRPSPDDWLVVPQSGDWFMLGSVDGYGRRTLPGPGRTALTSQEVATLPGDRLHGRLYYLALPYIRGDQIAADLATITRRHAARGWRTYSRDGISMTVYEFR